MFEKGSSTVVKSHPSSLRKVRVRDDLGPAFY